MRSATFETGLTIIQLTNQRTKLHVITSAHAVKVYMTTKHLRRISHGHFYFILLHSYCDVFKICELILHCNVLWEIHVLVDFRELRGTAVNFYRQENETKSLSFICLQIHAWLHATYLL